jgi:hypothetical protein
MIERFRNAKCPDADWRESGGAQRGRPSTISIVNAADAGANGASTGSNERRTWEAATLLAQPDRPLFRDVWVEGSR